MHHPCGALVHVISSADRGTKGEKKGTVVDKRSSRVCVCVTKCGAQRPHDIYVCAWRTVALEQEE